MQAGERNILWLLVAGSLGISLFLTLWLFFSDTFGIVSDLSDQKIGTIFAKSSKWLLATAFIATILLLVKRIFLKNPGERTLNILLLVAVLNLILIVPELGLRAYGFQYMSGVQFGYPKPEQFYHFRSDPNLFWVFDKNQAGVNAQGFHAAEFSAKQKENWRILFLGDSCTFQGYPDLVESILNIRALPYKKQVESINLSVPGYSSHQGRKIAELYGDEIEADLVVVFFGWNDHWRAYREPDHQKQIPQKQQPSLFVKMISKIRMVQALNRLTTKPPSPLLTNRVPPEHYKENLTAIARKFKKQSIPIIFLTAPSSHQRLGFPEKLVILQSVTDAQTAIKEHNLYNDIARQVARENGLLLLDLSNAMEATGNLTTLFTEDGIHFTPQGLNVVAYLISQTIETQVWPKTPEMRADLSAKIGISARHEKPN